ncbi:MULTISPECIES: RteC domain-containing protein [unclassified Leeuwenhoekiella]|uniref:RteC domain-containing protein n=1 Tax=unclassified Leeuwenhoekiella TaxID=2615029 RepID=UPI000C6866F6|nr:MULTISPECIES: RteC domain-containing protein [unclassified Leeuwenhoekiella]MAW94318.1 hypothetical protein [Leeuwenhoekiella sp.]MBA82999.1 hypothetical protein [Leeuwenhoekiella sp.]|tara:strand:- start:6285 stop:7103 length:819 start_codon:yes stop_codon:yes gene_type:complete
MEWDPYIKEFKTALQRLQKKQAHQPEVHVGCLEYVIRFQNQLEQDFKAITDLCEAEEIYFFKNVKPFVVSSNLYYRQLIQWDHEKPLNPKRLKPYYKTQLKVQHQFKLRHKAFAYYLKSNQTHLDSIYFTRREALPYDPDDLNVHLDRSYTTSRDLLTAKLTCADLISDYLKKKLEELEGDPAPYATAPHLDWSGTQTDLIELTYALYHAKVIHKGKADLIEIARALGSFFKLDTGDIYKTYAELKSRKKSRTKFLDELTVNLQHAMDRDDY